MNISSDKTMSYLALHYGLVAKMQASSPPKTAFGQEGAGTIFEAWIGAAFLQYAERQELPRFYAWLAGVLNPVIWYGVNDEFWQHSKVPKPSMFDPTVNRGSG